MNEVDQFLAGINTGGVPITGGGDIDLFAKGPGGFAFELSSAPQVIGAGASAASALNRKGAQSALRQFAEGRSAAEGEVRRGLGYGLAAAGVNPAFATGIVEEQRANQLTGEIAEKRSGLETQRAAQDIEIIGQATGALVSAEQYQDSLDQQRYLAAKARKALRKSQRKARYTQLAGAAIGVVTGGIGGGFLSAAGGALGFGSAGSGGGGDLSGGGFAGQFNDFFNSDNFFSNLTGAAGNYGGGGGAFDYGGGLGPGFSPGNYGGGGGPSFPFGGDSDGLF